MADNYQPPFPPTGGGGGGGIWPSSPQQACVLFTSSEIACGVQEKRPKLRKTVSKTKIIFFILLWLKVDTSVAVQILAQIVLQQHDKGKAKPFKLEKCGAQK